MYLKSHMSLEQEESVRQIQKAIVLKIMTYSWKHRLQKRVISSLDGTMEIHWYLRL